MTLMADKWEKDPGLRIERFREAWDFMLLGWQQK